MQMEALAYLRPVQFELTDQTRLAIDEYLRLAGRKPGQFLFSGRGDISSGLTRRQYARLVHYWLASIGLDLAKCVMAACPLGRLCRDGLKRLASTCHPRLQSRDFRKPLSLRNTWLLSQQAH